MKFILISFLLTFSNATKEKSAKKVEITESFSDYMKRHMTQDFWIQLLENCNYLKNYIESSLSDFSSSDLPKFDLENLISSDGNFPKLLTKQVQNKISPKEQKDLTDLLQKQMNEASWNKLVSWILVYELAILNIKEIPADLPRPRKILAGSNPLVPILPPDQVTFEEMLLKFLSDD